MSDTFTVTVEIDGDLIKGFQNGRAEECAIKIASVVAQEVAKSKPVARCPYEKIVALYRENCPSLKSLNGNISDRRKIVIRNAWKRFSKGVSEEDALTRFQWFFRRAERSDFLSGRLQQSGAYVGWKANLDFLLRPAQIDKIIDGGHDNE